jgi:hypothetical protein
MVEEAKEGGMMRKDLDVGLFVLVFLSAVQNILTPKSLSEQPFSPLRASRVS